MEKFEVGNRVLHKGNIKNHYRNLTGTIKYIRLNSISVEFDVNIEGHDCDGKCEYGHGWYVSGYDLTLTSDSKIAQVLLSIFKNTKTPSQDFNPVPGGPEPAEDIEPQEEDEEDDIW